jgi:hypothetical protein
VGLAVAYAINIFNSVSENLFEKGFGDAEWFLAIAEETENLCNIFLT